MIISLKISKEQKGILLLRYSSVKIFLQKAILDTANKIIEDKQVSDFEKKLDEYHERQALNAGVEWKEGKPFWKNRKHSQETKDKIRKALKAKGWKGIHLLEETKEKIGLLHKGKKLTAEVRRKISLSNKGRKRTEEQKKRIGESHKGLKYKKRAVKIK